MIKTKFCRLRVYMYMTNGISEKRPAHYIIYLHFNNYHSVWVDTHAGGLSLSLGRYPC
jgi:hypothetical protein